MAGLVSLCGRRGLLVALMAGAIFACGTLVAATTAEAATGALAQTLGSVSATSVRGSKPVHTRVRSVVVRHVRYRCGKAGVRWVPGNLVTGVEAPAGSGRAWFVSAAAQVRALRRVQPQTASVAGLLRSVRAAFPQSVSVACLTAGYRGQLTGPPLSLRLVSLLKKRALAVRTVTTRRHMRASQSTDVQALTAGGELVNAIAAGSAQVRGVFQGPTGVTVMTFDGAVSLGPRRNPDGCMVAAIDPITGETSCLLDTTQIVGWENLGSEFVAVWNEPEVRFDAAGNIYVRGDDPGGNQELLRINAMGSVTNLLDGLAGFAPQHYIVLPAGDVIVDNAVGTNFHLSSGGDATDISDCFSYDFAALPDGGALLGGCDTNILRYQRGADAVDAAAWFGPRSQTPRPTHLSDNVCSDTYARACAGIYMGYPSAFGDGRVLGLAGVYAGSADNYGPATLVEFYPSPRTLPISDLLEPVYGTRVLGTDKYAIFGFGAYRNGWQSGDPVGPEVPVGQCVNVFAYDMGCTEHSLFAIYDSSSDTARMVDLPYDMGIFNLISSFDGSSLRFAAKRRSNDMYVLGSIDVASGMVTIDAESDSPPTTLVGF